MTAVDAQTRWKIKAERKLTKLTKQNKKIAAALLGALAGVLIFLWVYGIAPLDVANDAWILNGYDEWDVQQHYAGWLLFRNSHWGFPLGLADTIAVPDGTVISYTDSLPWVSIFLKAMRGFLPADFQWFGWYVLVCFALQGAAGSLLSVRRTGLGASVVGGALFACLPTLWERAFRHTALASHWLYLFALYAYLEYRTSLAGCSPEKRKHRFPWEFALFSFLAVGIHPYFLPLVMVCALLAAVDCFRSTRQGASALLIFGAPLASALLGGLLCGALGSGVSASREGYGVFSMNLNAAWNPSSRGGYTWSRILPIQAQQGAQYDGFNYLGLGVLLLAALALVLAVVLQGDAAAWWKRNGTLFAACVFLTLFAASNKISFGSWSVEIPLPQELVSLCGIFRSSGRMFYLVGACILLFGIYQVPETVVRFGVPRIMETAVLALVLAVQIWDLSAVAAEKREAFVQTVGPSVVSAPETQTLGVGHRTLLAAGELREDRLRPLAILAGKQGLSTNLAIAVSGSYPQAAALMGETAETLDRGLYDSSVVYVTTDGGQFECWQSLFAGNPDVTLFVADSCYFLVPNGGG